jgi:two-component system, sensor histidine kinase
MRVLEDILDSSLTHPGSFELLDAPFDPAALLREVATQFSDFAAQQGLFLHAEVAPGVPSQVMGDAPRLREVVGHLLGNAVKFTQSGGITARLAAETDSSGAPLLVLRVLDTGPGIRRPGGAGPGLVICSQLANAMRGEMTCEDAPGGGAEFRFAVPLRQSVPVPSAPPARLPPARVLVVDDVSLNRKVLSAILERDGHQVVVAATGEEAVASVAEGPPFDLVLMDLHMPGMDGIAATAAIRSLPGAGARVAVHALTADVSAHTSAEYEAAGFTGFLTKPLDRSAIRQAIAAAQVKAAASVGCAAAPPVLDGAHLARIFEGLPREVVGQMLNEFLRSLGEVLARLREQRNDGPALAQEVHSLKGLAGNFGAARLGEALASFQAQLDGGVAAGALPLGPLEAAYRDTVEAIRAGTHLRLFDAAGVGPPQPHREGNPT